MKRADPSEMRRASPPSAAATPAAIERPRKAAGSNELFVSDAIAETLRALDIPYVAMVPGASYRGLQDSLVNHLGNERPQLLLCINEAHAVGIAHGWAKVTGRAMAAALHSNVGLFAGTMAIFNAWCDRMPMLVIGATGPLDSDQRRPWIDWIHTARDQGAIVRSYVKWDDLPSSPTGARQALLRGLWLAQNEPKAPVYICLDAALQESRLYTPLPPLDPKRFGQEARSEAPRGLAVEAARMLRAAKHPVILAGRCSRSLEGWNQRVALAEALNAHVVTDLKTAAAFPTDHPLHIGAPAMFADSATLKAVREADVVLALDWVDLAGTLKQAFGDAPPSGKIIQVSLDHLIHNGWSMDHQALPPVDLMLAASPDSIVPTLLETIGVSGKPRPASRASIPAAPAGGLSLDHLASALRLAIGDRPISFAHLPISWNGAIWPFRHPLDYLGAEGGGGVGGGPGIAVGVALALRDSGRMPVAVCGDGDFLMGNTALWTATHYRLPLLMIVANNRSFFNDEVHQERVATTRGRPVENKWIGQRIDDPAIDIAAMARTQGAVGLGPITRTHDLAAAFGEAIAEVEAGQVAVVDVHIEPGYSAAVASFTGGKP